MGGGYARKDVSRVSGDADCSKLNISDATIVL